MYADTDVPIKNGLEVSAEAVQDASVGYVEGQLGRPDVVAVRERKACERAVRFFPVKRCAQCNLTLLGQSRISPRVLELPALLYPWAARAADTVSVIAQDVDSVKHYDIWRLGGLLEVLARPCLVVQLRGGQRGNVRRVRRRDGNPVRCTQSAQHPAPPPQKTLLRFRNLEAPSKHSGLSSLSPNEPKSSLTRMSTCSGTSRARISP